MKRFIDGEKYERALQEMIEDLYDDETTLNDWFHFTNEPHAKRLGTVFQALSSGNKDTALLILQNMRKEFHDWIAPSLESKALDQAREHERL